MSEFKVGDIVVIRDWDDMASEFEHDSYRINCKFGFYEHMKHLCGNVAEIIDIHRDHIQLNFYDKKPGLDYYWDYSADMICLYDDHDDSEYELNESALIEFLTG